MDEEDGVHRLEGISDQKGGLIVKKKPPTFKVPQTSLLGLDKLAEKKRREREDAERKRSFSMEEEDAEGGGSGIKGKQRKYRTPQEETPTYTGGISQEARERLIQRLAANRNKEKGVYASTKGDKRNDKEYYEDYNRRYRERDRREREKIRYHRNESSRRDKDDDTPRFRDEPRTPNITVRNEPSKTSWEDDEDAAPMKRSSWDFPTPSTYRSGSGDWSERSTKSRKYDDSSRSSRDKKRGKYEDSTPRPTPAHRYNAWMKDRKRSGATPGKEDVKWDATVDRELWEEEQKRIDREWYNMDEGKLYTKLLYVYFNNCFCLIRL